jgi:hypothetical protein
MVKSHPDFAVARRIDFPREFDSFLTGSSAIAAGHVKLHMRPEAADLGVAASRQLIAEETEKWGKLIRAATVKAE